MGQVAIRWEVHLQTVKHGDNYLLGRVKYIWAEKGTVC